MKRVFLFTLTICFLLMFTGCIGVTYVGLQPLLNGYSSSSMNPAYGYEAFKWGSSFHTIENRAKWDLSESTLRRGECCIGRAFSSSGEFIFEPHGNKDSYVDETIFFFDRVNGSLYYYDNAETESYLYAAEDRFKKTPSMDFLHRRYGQFSEENLGTSYHKIYKGRNYLDIEGFHALEIEIYDNGKTIVHLRDPFYNKARLAGNPLNNWICYPELDSEKGRVNFTFLNKNKEDKYLFIGYSKGYNNPNISYVRAGICWGKDINGKYEIKGKQKLVSKDYLSENWNCSFEKKDYTFTNNKAETPRELLELFIENKRILVRHNGLISEFLTNKTTILDKMAEYGITWAEIDSALANEEF